MNLDAWIAMRKRAMLAQSKWPKAPDHVTERLLMLRMIEAACIEDVSGTGAIVAMQRVLNDSEKGTSDV